MSHRQVSENDPKNGWHLDLTASLASVLFARELVTAKQFPSDEVIADHLNRMLQQLSSDADSKRHPLAVFNKHTPKMMVTPSLQALKQSSTDEPRHFVLDMSDSWPSKVTPTGSPPWRRNASTAAVRSASGE